MRTLSRMFTAAAMLAATVAIPVLAPSPVAAADEVLVEVAGRGWGHGRGMGQYGAQGYALGYALNEPWTSSQILDHFYGETTAGPIPASASVDPAAVRVEIRRQRGDSLTTQVPDGTVYLKDPAGDIIYAERDAGAIRLTVTPDGIVFQVADRCGATWTDPPVFVHDVDFIELVDTNSTDGASGLLQLCHEDGSSTWYDGSLALHDVGGAARTVNTVSIEQYLRGVLPAEVPSSWEPAALESQAVAARSYAMAGDTRQLPYADTCDTTLCQVYRGRYRLTAERGLEPSTDPRTDAAIAATAGLVRIRDGGVARTEFSSSTGGHTAGGAFPAVEDLGDSVASNPNHTWTKIIDLSEFVAAQGRGDLLAVTETGNGLGEDGGRVVRVTFTFADGSVELTGNEARQRFGFKSDWFRFGELNTTAINSNGRYVAAVFDLFLQREPTLTEQIDWQTVLDEGAAKTTLTESLAGSDEWAGVMIDDLYQVVLGRSSDPGGRAYWLAEMNAGLRFEQVAANFFGAPEYYEAVGGTDAAFVTALYESILERSADDAGRSFWVDRLEDGSVTPFEVAAGFYASPESRTDRVAGLYQRILGRAPDESGLAHWTELLLDVDDVELAASLAASAEFFQAAQP